ncbi:MAG: CapA family protein [Candidatus Limnocylindrales bacterium]
MPTVPLAVVTGFSNYLVDSVTLTGLARLFEARSLILPCGAQQSIGAALGVALPAGQASVPCVVADAIPAHLPAPSTSIALLPPGLVTPAMRVVPIGSADLFGETPARTARYPLVIPVPLGWPASWTAYDAGNVRVVLTTGVNCPDRGVSYQTNVLKRGWDWLLQAGTARYTGRHWDPAFGWWVVDAVRTDHAGAVWDLVRNADVAVSDFECSMTSRFTQHDSGTVFSIDPRVAPLMAKAGFDVATIAADHNTNPGLGAIGETVDLFRANGIAAVGGGRTLAEALRPAVLDVRGVRFGFVGFDAIGGSASATATSPGVAPLTAANARTAIAEARAQGAQVVFALPQWSSVEYRAAFTGFQESLIAELVAAGADHIIGADFHWAGAISITLGSRSGYRFVTASQGNFWFGQDWSRQTQEGVMTMLTFVGTRLAQVRLIPTVVLDNAQPNLTNPATDGQFVLHQVLSVSRLLRP